MRGEVLVGRDAGWGWGRSGVRMHVRVTPDSCHHEFVCEEACE